MEDTGRGLGADSISGLDLVHIEQVLTSVKQNLNDVKQVWKELSLMSSSSTLSTALCTDEVIVPVSSLERIAAETDHMKTLMPKLLSMKHGNYESRIATLEEERDQVITERDGLRSEVTHWKTQVDTTAREAQKEKQKNLDLRLDVQELISQLGQQSEFTSSLGASCCTLLWKVSRQEHNIQTIITGSKYNEFLTLVSGCVRSYLAAYKDDQWPQQDSEEAQFILALCGTVTNIAASALGREHLASSEEGQFVLDAFLTFIEDAPVSKSVKMKSLMLMTLFNVSINQKGLKYLSSRPRLMTMLSCHLQEEKDPDNRVNTLRLLQSLTSDENNIVMVHELKENLQMKFLQPLTSDVNKDIRDLSLELIMDLRSLDKEQ